jgi:short-subunit dehydrogenase
MAGTITCHYSLGYKSRFSMQPQILPLRKRPVDIAILIFFLVNLLFITYLVDLEQLVIPDPSQFTYPIWPPPVAVDAVHWWGSHFDPLLMARPAWWRMTIWIDALFFGPFYLVAIYAYWRAKAWIRIPSIIYASMLLTNVLIILFEEANGLHATPNSPVVFLANFPWLVFPLVIILRMGLDQNPFARLLSSPASHSSHLGAFSPQQTPQTKTSSPKDRSMRSDQRSFADSYGPWALVAGASAGLGAEFASQLAARGLNLVLVARRAAMLQSLSEKLSAKYGIAVRSIQQDLAEPEAAENIARATQDIEVGLLVYNAAFSAIGSFFQHPLDDHLVELDTNCRTPLALVYILGQRMQARGRGGILLMSSLSAQQGSPYIANYAATKAYNWILAEGLWDELRRQGVDVLVCCAGAIGTPNYDSSAPSQASRLSGAVTTPRTVAASALAGLGKGPEVVPGFAYRLSAFAMQHLLPRKLAVRIMGNVLRGMYST